MIKTQLVIDFNGKDGNVTLSTSSSSLLALLTCAQMLEQTMFGMNAMSALGPRKLIWQVEVREDREVVALSKVLFVDDDHNIGKMDGVLISRFGQVSLDGCTWEHPESTIMRRVAKELSRRLVPDTAPEADQKAP